MLENIKEQAKRAVKELVDVAGLHEREILVIGCSSQ